VQARIICVILPKRSPSDFLADSGGRSHQKLDLFQKSDRYQIFLLIYERERTDIFTYLKKAIALGYS